MLTLLVRLNEKLFLESLGGHWALVRLTPGWPTLRGRGSPTPLTVWGTQLREMVVLFDKGERGKPSAAEKVLKLFRLQKKWAVTSTQHPT